MSPFVSLSLPVPLVAWIGSLVVALGSLVVALSERLHFWYHYFIVYDKLN